MAKIPFTVSARTARLIGQENFTNAEGAIIELVKNGYDADASVCIVYFDIKYSSIPSQIDQEIFDALNSISDEFASKVYTEKDGVITLKDKIDDQDLNIVKSFFSSQNSIYIIDNGDGMDDEVIKKQWMTIGTDSKLNDYLTKSGRIKAGAKGIGRFSLDRLGDVGNMLTVPKLKNIGFDWKVKWSDFEKDGAIIGEVTADLQSIENANYQSLILDKVPSSDIESIVTQKGETNFSNGTLLKVSGLRDFWTVKQIDKLYSNLEILTPPEGQQKFQVYLFSNLHVDNELGLIDNSDYSDYDYKIECDFKGNEAKDVVIKVSREEFDKDNINKEVFSYEDMKEFPFDKKTFLKGKYKDNTTIYKLLPGIDKSVSKNVLDKIGPFEFTFYFLKNAKPNSEDAEKYHYKEFNGTKRGEWLNKFGGIRIFKDGFRVRPYGESNSTFNDWLRLGNRYGQDPAGIATKGRWRVRPNQIAGSILLSRVSNLEFQEKSSREGFQENETFEVFKNIIISIIKYFEDDRSTIGSNLDTLYKNLHQDEQAESEADEIIDEEDNSSSGEGEEKSTEQLKQENTSLKKGYRSQKRKLAQKDQELKLSRALASAGLMIASFSHEFNSIKNKLDTRTFNLIKYLGKLLPEEAIPKSTKDHHNPYYLINKMKGQDEKLKQWIDFSLSLIKKDKRKATTVSLREYFDNLKEVWGSLLLNREAELIIENNLDDDEDIQLKIYELDLDTLFDNLLTNSVEAFQVEGFSGKRRMNIKIESDDETLKFKYSDSGPGLDEGYKQKPNVIFKPFETSKRDDEGNPVGTGLGMWLIKSTVDEYKGRVSIKSPKNGFALEVSFSSNVFSK